jgi:hypothetical protein
MHRLADRGLTRLRLELLPAESPDGACPNQARRRTPSRRQRHCLGRWYRRCLTSSASTRESCPATRERERSWSLVQQAGVTGSLRFWLRLSGSRDWPLPENLHVRVSTGVAGVNLPALRGEPVKLGVELPHTLRSAELMVGELVLQERHIRLIVVLPAVQRCAAQAGQSQLLACDLAL